MAQIFSERFIQGGRLIGAQPLLDQGFQGVFRSQGVLSPPQPTGQIPEYAPVYSAWQLLINEIITNLLIE